MVKEKTSNASQLLAHAKQLLVGILQDKSPIQLDTIHEYISTDFPEPPPVYPSNDRAALDDAGTKLWNATTRRMREKNGGSAAGVAPWIRAFAYLLVDASQPKSSSSSTHRVLDCLTRSLRLAVKSTRALLDQSYERSRKISDETNDDEKTKTLELCSKIVQRTAGTVKRIDDLRSLVSDTLSGSTSIDFVADQLDLEYWLLRTTLAWKQNREDLAAQHLAKCTDRLLGTGELVSVTEKYADLTYEIGRDFRKQESFEKAVCWLEKSCHALELLEDEHISSDARELRQSAMHELVQSLLGVKSDKSLSRARNLIEYLEIEAGAKFPTTILKLELLAKLMPFPADEFESTIRAGISAVVLTDATFKTILYYIQQATTHDSRLGCKVLDHFLRERLVEAANTAWTERALVLRIWIYSKFTTDHQEHLKSLTEVIHHVFTATGKTFDAEATYAAQTLMWKNIESAMHANLLHVAQAWGHLALEPIFAQAGEPSKNKIARKLIQVALLQGELITAKETYELMSTTGQREPLTSYLGYKIGVRSGDDGLAAESLKNLAASCGEDMNLLYACVVEAQQSGSRQLAISCLQSILASLKTKPVKQQTQLPVIIRCTFRLLMTELEMPATDKAQTLEEVADLVEAAALHVEPYLIASNDAEKQDVSTAELTWIAKSSYNLIIKHFAIGNVRTMLRLLDGCIVFTRKLDGVVKEETERIRLAQRNLLCYFLASSGLIVQARSTDETATAQEMYRKAMRRIQEFWDLTNRTVDGVQAQSMALERRSVERSEMLKNELECIVKLEAWEGLDVALGRCSRQQDDAQLETFADLVIVIHEEMQRSKTGRVQDLQSKIPSVLQGIINQAWRQDRSNMVKLARWIRCAFRMTVEASPDIAMQCLEQAGAIAQRDKKYPQDELEWLASTAFNHAVDLFCASDFAGYRHWGEAALNLCKMAVDDEGVYEQMQSAWLKLATKEQAMV